MGCWPKAVGLLNRTINPLGKKCVHFPGRRGIALVSVVLLVASVVVQSGLSTISSAQPATAWSWLPTPSAFPDAGLQNVSCASSDFCAAVGSAASGALTYAEVWDGSQWTYTPSPYPDFYQNDLSSVSCPSSQMCVAVGSGYDGGSGLIALAEEWNGQAWSVMPTPQDPDPNDLGSDLQSVSCSSMTFCMAIGEGYTETTTEMWASTWNGAAWAPMTVTTNTGNDYPEQVSCTSDSFCMTLGASGQKFKRAERCHPRSLEWVELVDRGDTDRTNWRRQCLMCLAHVLPGNLRDAGLQWLSRFPAG